MNHFERREKFKIHFYLKNESHAMNAFVRHKVEKDFLAAARQILDELGTNAEIKTEAYQEGGLVELYQFVSSVSPELAAACAVSSIAKHLSPSINAVLTHHLTKSKFDDLIKEETLKGQKLDNMKKEAELEDKQIERAKMDRLTRRHVSNIYKTLTNYEEVERVGFSDPEQQGEEIIINRNQFDGFILNDNTDIIEDDNALIEIISPVLKEGKYSWRGKYNDGKIDFSMGDAKFKKEVISGEHQFANGFSFVCLLQMTILYDEFGDEKRRSYSVKKVYGKKDLSTSELKLRPSGIKKKFIESQPSLLDDSES